MAFPVPECYSGLHEKESTWYPFHQYSSFYFRVHGVIKVLNFTLATQKMPSQYRNQKDLEKNKWGCMVSTEGKSERTIHRRSRLYFRLVEKTGQVV